MNTLFTKDGQRLDFPNETEENDLFFRFGDPRHPVIMNDPDKFTWKQGIPFDENGDMVIDMQGDITTECIEKKVKDVRFRYHNLHNSERAK